MFAGCLVALRPPYGRPLPSFLTCLGALSNAPCFAMGFKDFLIVFDAPLRTNAETFVHEVLGLREQVPLTSMVYEDLMRKPDYVAVAEYAGRTLIWWMDEAQNLVDETQPSVVEAALRRHDPSFRLGALAVYDVSNFYGFALFEGGEKIRCRSASLEGMHSDHGEPLAEERAFFKPTSQSDHHGLPLYEQEGELWHHHQIGGTFVHELGRRLLGGALHTDELPGFSELEWTVFGTPAQGGELRAWQEEQRRLETARFHNGFDMDELADYYAVPLKDLRERFALALLERVQKLLGSGFRLQTEQAADGNILLFCYFKAVRLVLFPAHQLPLRLARSLQPDVGSGEEVGLRLGYRSWEKDILPSMVASLETQPVPSSLAALVRCHEDESLSKAARAALEETIERLARR
jgi:hypothetical protein